MNDCRPVKFHSLFKEMKIEQQFNITKKHTHNKTQKKNQ